MNLLNDPMAAAFIPLVVLLVIGWGMYYVLARDDGAHSWWVGVLQSIHLVPKEPEPETPVGTKMNVVYLGPRDDAPPEPEPVDYSRVIARSRLAFKLFGLAMLVLTGVHAFRFYRRADPYFVWGPRPTKFANPADRGELPPPTPGAGGAGTAPFTRPEGQTSPRNGTGRAPGPRGVPPPPGGGAAAFPLGAR